MPITLPGPRYYAAYSVNSLENFRKIYRSHPQGSGNPLEDGTDKLSHNVGRESPLYSAQYSARAHILSISRRKPDIMQWIDGSCSYNTIKKCKLTPALIIVNDDQQYATILVYLFIPNQLYVFRVMSSPIIRST